MMPGSALLRFNARKALKGHWQTALLTAFTAGLFVTVFQVAFLPRLNNTAADFLSLIGQGDSIEAFISQMDWAQWIPVLVLYAVSLVFTPALDMGMSVYYLLRLEDKAAAFRTLFCRMGIFFKALVLNLLINAKILLWGAGAMAVFIWPIYLVPGFMSGLALWLANLAPIAALAAGGMAYYRHVLAPIVMAEFPAFTVKAAVRFSKRYMRGRKKSFFLTQLSFAGWFALSLLLSGVLTELLGDVISLAAGLFADLALSVYMRATYTSFYKTVRNTHPEAENS